MRGQGFNYPRMLQRALRSLMVEVLVQVAKRGLPGEHHLYFTIETTHPGLVMPEWLREQYPATMSIVLQHEFTDLAVAGDRFSVTLSFGNRPATLVVPFDAVTTFADPFAKFGLRFDGAEHDAGERADPGDDPDNPGGGRPKPPREQASEVISIDAFRKR